MVKRILENLEGAGVPKEMMVTILLFAFGICLFISGVYLGEKVQYDRQIDTITWYKDNCLCLENVALNKYNAPELNYSLNESGFILS